MISGACHCGAVCLEFPEIPETVTDCNCSICRRLGVLWAYGDRNQIRIVAEPGATVAYIQGDRLLETHHCRICGCTTHWVDRDPTAGRMAVNARLFDPVVLSAIPVRKIDGASW